MGLGRLYRTLDRNADHAYTVLRIGLGFTILLAGTHKLFRPAIWASYTAPWVAELIRAAGIAVEPFMRANGVVEAVFGLAILADRYTTLASTIVALSLLGIVINLATAGAGFVDILIRDIGLLLLAVGVSLMAAERRTA